MQLSLPQLSYLQTSLAADSPIRPDGRRLTEYRPLSIAIDVIPQCLGSCQVEWGPFNLLAIVKGEVVSGEPTISVNVEVRGERDDDPGTILLAEILGDIVQGGKDWGIDSEELHVVHGKAWALQLEIVLSTTDGSSSLSAASLAARLALMNTRLPKTTAVGQDGQDGALDSAAGSSHVGLGDFDVDDDFSHAVPILSANKVPLVLLVNHCGNNTFFDASFEEEHVLVGREAIGVVPSRPGSVAEKAKFPPRICYLRSIGSQIAREGVQGLAADARHALTPLLLQRAMLEAIDVGSAILAAVDEFLSLDQATAKARIEMNGSATLYNVL
ncbi:Exosome complex component rrp42 [Savitreella phatthalungensis]